MKYSIITPTYNRPELLEKTLGSVLVQSHGDWEIIIINDSPDYDYSTFENKYIIDSKDFILNFQNNPERIIDVNLTKIKYFKNKKNVGVNFSRNFALSKISDDVDYIIFLDDDDCLYLDSLKSINKYLEKNKFINWLICDNYFKGSKVNSVKKIKESYSYFFNYLLFKNIRGDCTHIIKKGLATSSSFSKKIKNGEEWTYFINLKSRIHYLELHAKDIGGYLANGLTSDTKNTYTKNTRILFSEKKNLKVFIILIIRILNIIVKTVFK